MKKNMRSFAAPLLVPMPYCASMAMGSNQSAVEVPPWLRERIGEISKAPPANPPVQVYHCRWQGLLPVAAMLRQVQRSLRQRGPSGGGITGMGDGKCKSFSLQEDTCMLIWKDKRP